MQTLTETIRTPATSSTHSHLRHAAEHKHRPEDKIQVLRVLLYGVELQHVVLRERIEIQSLPTPEYSSDTNGQITKESSRRGVDVQDGATCALTSTEKGERSNP